MSRRSKNYSGIQESDKPSPSEDTGSSHEYRKRNNFKSLGDDPLTQMLLGFENNSGSNSNSGNRKKQIMEDKQDEQVDQMEQVDPLPKSRRRNKANIENDDINGQQLSEEKSIESVQKEVQIEQPVYDKNVAKVQIEENPVEQFIDKDKPVESVVQKRKNISDEKQERIQSFNQSNELLSKSFNLNESKLTQMIMNKLGPQVKTRVHEIVSSLIDQMIKEELDELSK